MNATREGRTTQPGRARRWAKQTQHFVAAAMLLTLTAPASALPQVATPPQELLGQAIHQETAMGDLPAAIALYERVVAHGSVDPATRQRAELRLAGLLEKTGDAAGARKLLEGIIAAGEDGRAYGEITDAAREALAALGEPEATPHDRIKLPTPSVEGANEYSASPDGRYSSFTAYNDFGQNVGVFEYETEEVTWMTNMPWEEGIADSSVWAEMPT